MTEQDQAKKRAEILFIVASLFTFGFITLLQFAPMPWFFLVLVAMHIGIALFIISKRSFKKMSLEVARFYQMQYLLLVPYLGVMFYTFAARAGVLPLYHSEKTVLVLIYSTFCAAVTAWNYLRFRKSLDQQIFENSTILKSTHE